MSDKVIVFHSNPIPVHGGARIFSLSEHGQDYKKIAAEYAKSHAENVIKMEGLDEEAEKEVVIEKKKKAAVKK